MARIVLSAWGTFGDIFPALGIALALKARGHQPVLATCPWYREAIEGRGIEFAALRPDIDPDDLAFAARVMDPWRGAEAIFREALMPALESSLADMRAVMPGADLVVSHPVTFAGRMAAEEAGVPWLSTVLSPISFFSAHDLPLPPGAPWMRHTRSWGLWWGRAFRAFARHQTDAWFGPLHALRARLGLPAIANPLFEGMFSSCGTLALFSPAFSGARPDWPARTTLTGFIDYNGGEPLTTEVAAFLDEGEAPLVFTLGTSAVFVAGSFYEESMAAARALGRRALLLTGPRHLERVQALCGPDMMAAEFAPHAAVFPRALAIVHQAGMGTLAQGLRSGRPTLIVPHANDQPDNAWRAAGLGTARVLLPRQYRAAAVAKELDALLSGVRYLEAASRMRDRLLHEDGARSACDVIEACLTEMPPVSGGNATPA